MFVFLFFICIYFICCFFFFFFNDTATTEIYTLSLHDALPIQPGGRDGSRRCHPDYCRRRSEEHTSELQSPCNLVCRLLLEKKKKKKSNSQQKKKIKLKNSKKKTKKKI